MMIVKRIISTNVEEDIETTKRKIIVVPEPEEKKIMSFVSDIVDDDGDYESSYNKGISCDFNDEVSWIRFDWLLTYLKDRQTDLEEEDEKDEGEYKINEEILPIITKYKGYTL